MLASLHIYTLHRFALSDDSLYKTEGPSGSVHSWKTLNYIFVLMAKFLAFEIRLSCMYNTEACGSCSKISHYPCLPISRVLFIEYTGFWALFHFDFWIAVYTLICINSWSVYWKCEDWPVLPYTRFRATC